MVVVRLACLIESHGPRAYVEEQPDTPCPLLVGEPAIHGRPADERVMPVIPAKYLGLRIRWIGAWRFLEWDRYALTQPIQWIGVGACESLSVVLDEDSNT